MKKLLLMIMVLALAASCKVLDPYEPNQFNEKNISSFCNSLFEEEVSYNIVYFYNAYHIARFIEADAEQKVSPEFDMIRTGLSYSEDRYVFDYDDYRFSTDSLFIPGGIWRVRCDRNKNLHINVGADKEWTLAGSDSGTVMNVKLTEESPEMMRMLVSVKGTRTEDSEFSARFSAEELEVTIGHKYAGKIESMAFRGEMQVVFYEGAKGHRTCVMTMVPELKTSYAII